MHIITKATKTKTMSMKDIENANATKANATRGNVYTIQKTQIHTNKYIEDLSNKKYIEHPQN